MGLERLGEGTVSLGKCFGDAAGFGVDFFITELPAKLKNASPSQSTGTRLTTVRVLLER